MKKAPLNGAFSLCDRGLKQGALLFADGAVEADLDGANGEAGGSGELAGVHLAEVLLDEFLLFVDGFALGDVEGFAAEGVLYLGGDVGAGMIGDEVKEFVSEHVGI